MTRESLQRLEEVLTNVADKALDKLARYGDDHLYDRDGDNFTTTITAAGQAIREGLEAVAKAINNFKEKDDGNDQCWIREVLARDRSEMETEVDDG